MSFGRSALEEEQYKKFRHPGTGVLINKLGIEDPKKLEAAERYFAENRSREILPHEALKLNYAGLKAIHRHLFQDVYEWAGGERTYTTGRGPSPFAPPEQIGPWMTKQFANLKAENNLVGLKPSTFAERAAAYVNEINAAHPFVEGNGRTQRTWLRVLAENSGYTFTLSPRDKNAWYEASRIGFEKVDHRSMTKLILDNLASHSRERDQEHER